MSVFNSSLSDPFGRTLRESTTQAAITIGSHHIGAMTCITTEHLLFVGLGLPNIDPIGKYCRVA
jgi:hypothetical protein